MFKNLLTKTLLVVAALCAGSSVWAADVWIFNNTSIWGNETSKGKSENYKEIATGSEVWFAPDGTTATSETCNVSFKFVANGAKFNYGGTNSLGISSTGNYDSENDINYVKINLPVNYRVHIDLHVGTSARPMHIDIDGSDNAITSDQTYSYTNNTNSSQTIKIYGTNGGNENYNNHTIKKIIIVNTATAASYSWTANAVATIDGNPTTIKTYNSAANVMEYDNYTITADKIIQYNGAYYALNDAAFASNVFGVTYTMGVEMASHSFNYEEFANCVFYDEAENIVTTDVSNKKTESGNSKLSNAGGVYTQNANNSWITLEFEVPTNGVYDIALGMNNDNNKERGYKYSIDGGADSEELKVTAYSPSVLLLNNQLFTKGKHTIKLTQTYSRTPIFDYIYVTKVYDVVEWIGATDNSTSYESSIRGSINKELTISQGDKIKINFNNHGSGANNWNNWALRITNSGTSFDRGLAGGNHINQESGETFNGYDQYNNITQKWFINNVDNYITFMENYKTKMMDANVDMTIEYKTDGTLSVTTESTVDNTYYKYVFTRDVALDGNVTLKLGVDNAWLEVLSVEQTAVGMAVPDGKQYATFSSDCALDFSNSCVSAYTAKVNGNEVTLTKVTTVPANEGLLIRNTAKDGATFSVPVIASANEVDNDFEISDGTTLTNGYVLATVDGVQGFYPVNGTTGTTIAAGKAYLPAGNGARLSMVFDDEATGISAVAHSEAEADGAFYNLKGQRVAAPTKGIFIKNGKKVIVK